MNKPFLAWLLLLLALLPAMSRADESTPLLYTRANIVIMRNHPPAAPALPWQKAPEPGNPAVTFAVEVRNAMTLYNQKGWFNLSSPSPDNGILMAFSAPSMAPVIHSSQYAPLDILLIDREGKITQIVPNIMLSQLEQEIMPQNPILAFLFLQGGICAKLSINPGDIVDYKIFHKPPTVLTTPAPSEPAPASAPAPAVAKAPLLPETPAAKPIVPQLQQAPATNGPIH